MAFITYVDLDPAEEQFFFSNLTPDSRFLYSKVKKKTTLFSAKKKKAVASRSLLPQIASLWDSLSPSVKSNWTTSGSYSGLNGWRQFIAEQSIRIKLGLSVPSDPSNFHNSWIGHLSIGGSATQIKIAQYHPAGYYVRRKVSGFKKVYAPVFIEEKMTLPLTIGLSYCCDLTPTGPTQYAKMYAEVISSYQGVDRSNIVEINFDTDGSWHTETATLTETLGYVIGYTLYVHIYGYTGEFYMDHIKAIHSGVNYARDKNCYDINVAFSNQWYQVPKAWVAIEAPSGAIYESDYIDF